MKGIIYKATNTFNGKVYIGQTIAGLPKRRQQHLKAAKGDESNLFHFALYQYPNGFTWEVIDTFSGDREFVIHALNVAEEYFIIKYDATNPECGYNSTQGGYSSDKFADHIKRRAESQGRGSKAILQYDIEGNFVAEFESINAVSAHLGKDKIHLPILVQGIHYGYQWREKKNEYYPKTIGPYSPQNKAVEPVVAYDGEGRLYKEFPSIKEAKNALGCLSVRPEITDIEVPEHFKRNFYLFRRGEGVPPETINITIRHKRVRTNKGYTACTPVVAYTLEGKLYKAFPSMIQAREETGCGEKAVKNYCAQTPPIVLPPNSRTKYIWQYNTGNNPDTIEIIDNRAKKVTKFVWRYIAEGHKVQVPVEITENRVKHCYKKIMEHRIIQYDLDGNFIKVWESARRATEEGMDTIALIRKSLKGEPTKKRPNYQWRYYSENYPQKIDPRNPALNIQRANDIIHEIARDGRIIASYNGASEAAKATGLSPSYICNVLAGRIHYPKRKFRRA